MNIPKKYHATIKSINLHTKGSEVAPQYDTWIKAFEGRDDEIRRVGIIKNSLGKTFGRKQLVGFYAEKRDEDITSAFIATMIWGHEAPPSKHNNGKSKRDHRGPSKVAKMFNESKNIYATLNAVSVENDESIGNSYTLLDKGIKYCGPSFFTKHLYFLGKSFGKHTFPLIFDIRVASGLSKLRGKNSVLHDMTKALPITKAEAYLSYLDFARIERARIGCKLDAIEYFLFDHMNRTY